MVVLVTGASGQLGQSLQFIAGNYPDIEFVFCSSSDLDITNKENCNQIFAQSKPHFCINAAAYTAVDKAESEPEKAHLINVIGAKNLAEACRDFGTTLLHISTDFVFDGTSFLDYARNDTLSVTKGYTEADYPNPQSVYGQTKLGGEKVIQEILDNHFIIRTSWVYSQFGNNFMKTMIRLGLERDSLSVVNDQIGTPTNAVDLAEVLIKIISSNFQLPTSNYGIYNFSNDGACSWFDFAQKIFEINHINIDLNPIPTTSYPTPAKRPKYSVLDKSKIKTTFGIAIKRWEESLSLVII
jgi:dTDP-4-dehydrorhamnose reductase